ncbi:Lin0368 family putative glycerol transporter subunit [Streptococcus parauberis]|uniref:Lin0368 family putative glycerol transporter subunit n=1 Tax=Streptococcus parauberis TaxID=1348 RepID=UPI00374D9E3D
MKRIRGILAYSFAAIWVTQIWRLFAAPVAPYAGFVVAIIAITPAWYICHYRGFIAQSQEEIAIDMGGIGSAVFVSNSLKYGLGVSLKSFPTLLCLVIGACLAGCLYEKIEIKRY